MTRLMIEGGKSDGMVFECESIFDVDDIMLEHLDGTFYWVSVDDLPWCEYRA